MESDLDFITFMAVAVSTYLVKVKAMVMDPAKEVKELDLATEMVADLAPLLSEL